MEDGRVHDRAGLDADPLRLQRNVYRLQHQPVQVMPFQHVAEAQDRGLVRCRRDADSHEVPHRRRLVQKLIRERVG